MAKVGAGSPSEDGRAARARLEKRKQELRARITQEFQRGKANFMRSMVRERLSGASPSSLARRTGQLARSLDAVVVAHDKAVVMVGFIGGGVPYAKIHEYGGTITPKNGKYLAIPLGPAKTKGGDSRVSGPRNWPNKLIFIKGKGTTKLLVEVLGKTVTKKTEKTIGIPGGGTVIATSIRKVFERAFKTVKVGKTNTPGGTFDVVKKTSIRPIFLLVESVTIPARLNFRTTFQREANTTLDRVREAVASINSVPI